MTKEKLSLSDIREIFGAISIAEGEIGDEYGRLKMKLYRMYPEIQVEHKEREEAWKREGERQRKLRKAFVEEFLKILKKDEKIFPQVRSWYVQNQEKARKHCTDEICFSADLWRYGENELIFTFSNELRDLASRNENLMYKLFATEKDMEMWHYLARLLENVTYEARRRISNR